ncbi:MAG: alanine--tRNA ligase [Candidatus Omnitrophica bacterium]|nr:alanine--tRNA ligase [Candidatus Omnitrophota bacterium]
MTSDQLRQRFLDFFVSKGHKLYPSDTLVTKDDPTVLFSSAGMNQFKQEFLGKPSEFKRRVSCQKCLRTGDLDKVGKTKYHHTFFEMLGNFSFGDYFKQEAISWAWEFVTKELNLPSEKLWVSVYQEDQEAYRIWQEKIALPAEKIVKLGPKENFWPANAPEEGPNGPCGPCSEIFYDQGEDVGCGKAECSPACDCGRFVEIWNLVFTQFDRKDKNVLAPLPHKNIDTGMGLERTASVLQGASNNFEIDIFQPITKEIMRLGSFASVQLTSGQYRARNAIADHIRAVCFAVAEGIVPSNDARGYVIRKLIRRAVWHGQTLGMKKPYLYKLVPALVGVMQTAYPDLKKKREDVAQVVLAEEKRFHKTLKRALSFAETTIAQLKAKGAARLPGAAAFKLYDTYGLPVEMLKNLVDQRNFKLDEPGFAKELELQRQSSRSASAISESVFIETLAAKYKLKPTNFVGDQKDEVQTRVTALFKNEQLVEQADQGAEIKVVLETTPFYGESGGQIGDTGIIENKNTRIEVLDTKKVEQIIFHLGRLSCGRIKTGERVKAKIDLARRKNIACNHTATHLLQAALRKVLGTHVRQAGSWVGPERLRFDFTHFQPLSLHELKRVEELVNQAIKEKYRLKAQEMDFEQSQEVGALAFFGDKYQERVRAVKIGDISFELCGGTHVSSTGDVRMFKIIAESSIASGIRRIEATAGKRAEDVITQEQDELDQAAQSLGCPAEDLSECVDKSLRRLKGLTKRLEHSRLENFKSGIDDVIASAFEVKGVKVITQEVKSADAVLLRMMADMLKQKLSPCVVVLAATWEGRALLVCGLSPELKARGLDAAKIIRQLAEAVGGSGGGRADFAQAGGNNLQGISRALSRVEQIINQELKR